MALTMLLCVLPATSRANTTTTVSQVTQTITLSDDVDYVITSETPFAEEGVVNITNLDHAVVILSALRPSEAIQQLSHIQIDGQRASNQVNCQVKIHNRGSIIMPYKNDLRPLTVYSEPDFGGEAVNDFGLENSGGFMNTLSDEKLNNRIRSFKLKRGYMVTFSTQARGRGYSRCFIAATEDLEVASLPLVLDRHITSYRIFKWNDTGKAGLANDTRSDPVNKLHVTTCYSFGLGEDRGSNCECVPHHIYEDWPSASACGGVTYSPHMKTNNEPGNSADDHPQSVDDILNNWENLMATGMRLCSPSSHDGSLNHLRAFMDSIDARGWRCDIIDLHCYWTEGSFNNIKSSWVDRYHRPIWISEWVWGASWNNNGIFGIATGNNRDNPTQSQLNQNKTAVQSICSKLNSWDYIERYYYWNSEANCSKLYLSNGTLTPAGEYYAGMNTGVGYNGKYEFVPKNPRMYGISDFKVTTEGGTALVAWYDRNGEFNQLMEVQRKVKGGQWEVLSVITPKDGASRYTYTDEAYAEGTLYRVHIIDLEGVERFTNDDIEAGDVYPGDEPLYLGGNLLTNGAFDLGSQDWQNGAGSALTQPYFQVVREGGCDGGSYLQCYGNGGVNDQASLKRLVGIQPHQDYYFRVAARNGGSYMKVSLTDNGTSESQVVSTVSATADWQRHASVFNSGDFTQLLLAYRWLGAQAQIDEVELRPLFKTQEEAIAHGVAMARAKTEALKTYNVTLPTLNDELDATLSSVSGTDRDALTTLSEAVNEALSALNGKNVADSLMQVAAAVSDMKFDGQDDLLEAMQAMREATTAQAMNESRRQLSEALQNFLPLAEAGIQPVQPRFATANGWEVKAGTYTAGDQRLNTVGGKTCWNAWWSGINAAVGKNRTMEIRQHIDDVPEGLYALECKATTQHYCLSDQHGYLVHSGDTVCTPTLTYDYFDLPTVGNMWQTLTTQPVYVEEGGRLTIGFVGSKAGAVDNAWRAVGDVNSTGDKREGWWCATDFVLRFHPLHKAVVTPQAWGTVCLPYAYAVPEGAHFYQIAGVSEDLTKLYIEEITEVEAGKPCIYISDRADMTFYEYGDAVKSPLSDTKENGLRGFFETSTTAPSNSYVLRDGSWWRVTGDRPEIEDYSAIIYKIDRVPVLSAWTGMSMDIHDDLNAIHTVRSASSQLDGIYTLGGQRVSAPRGVHIEVKDGQARKYIP